MIIRTSNDEYAMIAPSKATAAHLWNTYASVFVPDVQDEDLATAQDLTVASKGTALEAVIVPADTDENRAIATAALRLGKVYVFKSADGIGNEEA